jgi:hypothetical protein
VSLEDPAQSHAAIAARCQLPVRVRLGGDTFLSFDRQAVALLQQRGIAAELLA